MARPIVIDIRASAKQAIGELDSLSRSFSRFGANIRSIASTSSQAVSGIRQMAQGIQNLGFVTSFFIGMPLTRAISDVSQEVLGFDKNMIEVQKTTGITSAAIDELGKRIRNLSLTTPTSAQELATLAAEAGRAGVTIKEVAAKDFGAAIDKIFEFVRVTDMMQVSTTLTGEEAAKAFGRFVTVFKDLETDDIERLGSAINELGQSASVTEQEIVSAMLRIAPTASVLGMTAHEVAALATAITQMSESSSRGGNRVRVALEQMTKNYEEAAKLIGVSVDEMKDRLNNDALPTFLEIIGAISEIGDSVERQAVVMEIFGSTGANAVNRFAEAYDPLIGYVNIANEAFEDGVSLQREFNRALSAVSNQLEILKSTIIEAGMALVTDLLPIAKQVIGALIAAFTELIEIINTLTERQKLLIVGIAAAVTVGLPLLALLGSLGFGLAMILNGVVNLIGGLVGLIATFLTLGSGAAVISTILSGLAAIIGIALATAVLKGTGAFESLIDWLNKLAAKANDWGESFIAEIAGGIISGAARFLVTALEFVAGIISSFFEASSPPKTGPLSTIDEWGTNLIDTFLQGFKRADFGVLKEVAGIISRVFEQISNLGKGLGKAGDIPKALKRARELVAEVMYTFNKTGQIAEGALSELGNMLGDMGDRIAKLIRLQLKYNQAVQELDKIRARAKGIDEAYQAELRAIQNRQDLTETEKMMLIRQARERKNLSMENAETEERAAERNVEGLRDQLDWQKEYVNSLLDQRDVFSKLKEELKNVAKAIRKIGKALKDMLGDLLKKLAINLKMQELYSEKGLDTTALLREELSLRKRIVAELLKINDPTEEQQDLLDENLERIKELQDLLGDTGDIKIPTKGIDAYAEAKKKGDQFVKDLQDNIEDIGNILSKGRAYFDFFKTGLTGEIDPQLLATLDESELRFYSWGDRLRQLWDNITGYWDGFKAGLRGEIVPEGLNDAQQKLYNFGNAIYEIKEKIKSAIDEIGENDSVKNFGEKFGSTGNLMLPIIIGLIAGLKLFGRFIFSMSAWSGAFGVLKEGAKGFLFMRDALGDLAKFSLGKESAIGSFIGNILGSFKRVIPALSGTGKKIGSVFKGGVVRGLLGGAGTLVKGLLAAAKSFSVFIGGVTLIGGAVVALGAIIAGVVYYIIKHWDEFKERFQYIFDSIKGALEGFKESFKAALGIKEGTTFKQMLGEIWAKVEPLARFLSNVLVGALVAIGDVLRVVGPALGTFFGGLLRGIMTVAAGIFDILGGLFGIIQGFWKLITGEIKWDEFKGIVWDALKGITQGILEIFAGVGTALLGALRGVFDTVSGLLGKLWETLEDVPGLGSVLKFMADFTGKIAGFFKNLYDVVVGKVAPDFSKGILKWFGKPVKFLKKAFATIKKVIQPFVTVLKSLGNIIRGVVSELRTAFEEGGIGGVFDKLKELLPQILPMLSNLGTMFLNALKNIGAMILQWVTSEALPAIGQFVVNAYNFLKENLPMWIRAIFFVLSKISSTIIDWITTKAIPAISAWLSRAAEYIQENAPSWWAAIKTALAIIASKIWEWITTDALPAIAGWISGAYEYIKENAPDWANAILTALESMAAAIWTWIIEEGLPAIASFITDVYNYLVENVPIWATAIKNKLGEITSAIWRWVLSEAIPKLRLLITKGLVVLGDIATKWVSKAKEGLTKVKEKFEEVFEQIKKSIKRIIKGAINSVIKFVETGMNRVIDALNKLVEGANKILGVLGMGHIGKLDYVKLPRLAKGGIAMEPTIAIVGDAPGGEAIIPLNRLSEIAGGAGTVNITIENPIVRNDDDLQEILDAITSKLGVELGGRMDMLGRAMGY